MQPGLRCHLQNGTWVTVCNVEGAEPPVSCSLLLLQLEVLWENLF